MNWYVYIPNFISWYSVYAKPGKGCSIEFPATRHGPYTQSEAFAVTETNPYSVMSCEDDEEVAA